MLPARIQNPTTDVLRELRPRLAAREPLIAQFDAPNYSADQLSLVDSLCADFGALLEVRFFGHYHSVFDFRALDLLPHVANLAVDCLQRADNTEALSELAHLERLSLGVFELEDREILKSPNLRSLRELAIGDTRHKAIDLSFLSAFSKLDTLFIYGHHRGLGALASLPLLHTLTLSAQGKRTPLDVVCNIPSLRRLRLTLGGRSSIAEIDAPNLQELELVRVQGLADLGDLSRFPALESFEIEDQIRIERLAFSSDHAQLRTLRIVNCKSLHEVVGLPALSHLELLVIYKTALSADALLALALPPRVKTLSLCTGKNKEDDRIQETLRARGNSPALL